MIEKIQEKRKLIHASGSNGEFLEKIKKIIAGRGYSEKNLVFRCIRGPEDDEVWQARLIDAAARHEGDLRDFIVALPEKEAEKSLNNGVYRVEVYDKARLLPTDYNHVYQFLPGARSLIRAFNKI